ncbi:MAG: hypothetical protein ACRCXT_09805 [Paraclostridium sp.]
MIKLSSKYVIMSKDRKYGIKNFSSNEYCYFEISDRYANCSVDDLAIFSRRVFAESTIESSKIINTYGRREFKKYDVEVVEVERFIK